MALSATYDPKQWEEQILDKWTKSGVGSPERQAKEQDLADDAETYTILMPPPNLTGDLHAGHAFQHFLMDTLTRVARQKGKKSLWYPGVDHAGIQMEGVINKIFKKEEGRDRDDVSDKEFLDKCWEKSAEWRDNQKNQAAILGDTPDYDRELFTLDKRASKMVNYAFRKYWEDGLIYKGAYLVNWSVGLQTALSDVTGEIEYEDRIDPFITFFYKFERIEDTHNLLLDNLVTRLSEYFTANPITVATVRPETITGDVAIAMHPDRFQSQLAQAGFKDEEIDKIKSGVESGKIFILSSIKELGVEDVQLLISDKVDNDFGTGALKITPAHDQLDYDLYHEMNDKGVLYKTGFAMKIGRDGKMTDECHEEFAGLTVEEARILAIRKLLEHGYAPLKESDEE